MHLSDRAVGVEPPWTLGRGDALASSRSLGPCDTLEELLAQAIPDGAVEAHVTSLTRFPTEHPLSTV
jgi:hypothetical protein